MLHRKVVPPEAVSVVLVPVQIDVLPVILAEGMGFTVTVPLAAAVHPAALVAVTVYVPAVVVVIDAVVAVVFQT